MTARVTGHASLRDRKRGPVWYLKYRLADGRQVQKLLGPAWTERGQAPRRLLHPEDRRGRAARAPRGRSPRDAPGLSARSGKTFDDACAEWLRYVEHDKQRAPSTLRDYGNVVNGVAAPRVRQGHAAREDHDGADRRVARAAARRRRAGAPDDPEGSRPAVRGPEASEAPKVDPANPAEDVERVT